MLQNSEPSWLEATRTYAKCPNCQKGLLDTRIPRGFLFKYVFIWLKVKRYRCNNCSSKVYVPESPNS